MQTGADHPPPNLNHVPRALPGGGAAGPGPRRFLLLQEFMVVPYPPWVLCGLLFVLVTWIVLEEFDENFNSR